MALLKTLDTDFGVPATYWHILSIDVNRVAPSATVVLLVPVEYWPIRIPDTAGEMLRRFAMVARCSG